ncbi:hypothetical protein Ccrd_026697 [Cynara cardunculus var. scolymus]|uniref:Uncharacterized protein n=1 Tax=Cynara cardunculus var. scolymus TaxID=59895 RepID=A0A103XD65_CYNCS|nr:hypothetical protein Ccrd_026697 [Cynara cardunculus var. scolymus]
MASIDHRNIESEEEEVRILSTSDPLLGDPPAYTIMPVPQRHNSPSPPVEVNLFKEEPMENDLEASSNFAPVAPIAPQGLVPVWTMGAPPTTGGAFFMIPQNGMVGPSSTHHPQLWAIPAGATPFFSMAARPISNFVSAMQPGGDGEIQAPSRSVSNNSGSEEDKSGRVSTTMAPSSSSVSTAQMLRDFSLEIYDKREHQFMEEAGRDGVPGGTLEEADGGGYSGGLRKKKGEGDV